MKRKISGIFILIVCLVCASLFAACDFGDLFNWNKHEHDYAAKWASDDENHWHECLNSGCSDPHSEWGAHVDSDEDYKCDVCGRVVLPAHQHDYQWVDNGDGTHKQHCDVNFCDEPDINEGGHYFELDGLCVCGAEMVSSGHEHTLTLVPEVEANCTEGGNIAYYTCSGCALLFLDENGEEQVLFEDTLTEPRGHQTESNGICSVCGNIDWEHEGLNLLELSKSTYGYDYLGTMEKGEARQSLYEAIDKEVVAVHNNVTTTYVSKQAFAEVNFTALNLSAEDAVAVWKIYRDDNPLFYWFSNQIGYGGSKLYLYVADDYLEGAVRRECNQLIYTKVQEYIKYSIEETSAYQIALSFHDKIITAVDYAYDGNDEPESAQWAHSILGVFEERNAVCEGYAKTFQLLLNLRGVENIMVDGIGGGGAHAWNLIRLDDGQWYWCDLTWDDAPEYTWGLYYGYFCVTDFQGVRWVDGDRQDGTETGIGIGGSPAGCETFLTRHAAYTSKDVATRFLYDLPARSNHVYAGVEGELTLRDTFEADSVQYAVAGYGTAQVTKVEASGSVVIPETVTFEGNEYKVISIGVIGGTKLFGAGDVFNSAVTELTLPSGILFIWSQSFYNCNFSEITFNGTPSEWNSIEKQNYWKRTSKPFTVHCVGGDVSE